MKFINYYEVFGIPETATQQEIKKAYIKLVRKYHPDANYGISEEEKKYKEEMLKKINDFNDVLTNAELKKEYDQQLKEYKLEQEKIKQEEIEREKRRQEQERIRQERERRYREAREKQQSNNFSRTEQHKTRYHADDPYHRTTKIEKTALENIKAKIEKLYKEYKEVKKEEQRYPFKKRHKDIDKNFYKRYYQDSDKIIINIGNQVGRITLHALGEIFTQVSKLGDIKNTTFTKYVIKNRNLATGALIVAMTFNILAGPTNEKSEAPITSDNVIENIVDPDDYIVDENNIVNPSDYQPIYTLNRYHTVEAGDTLSGLAYDANIKQSSIRRLTPPAYEHILQIGEELVIPYKVEKEDLKYYTYTEKYPENTSLEEFAEMYNTDVKTLVRLNEEAIIEENGTYYVESSTLVVPKFISQEELETKKEKTKQYQ